MGGGGGEVRGKLRFLTEWSETTLVQVFGSVDTMYTFLHVVVWVFHQEQKVELLKAFMSCSVSQIPLCVVPPIHLNVAGVQGLFKEWHLNNATLSKGVEDKNIVYLPTWESSHADKGSLASFSNSC